MNIFDLVGFAASRNASDLHLSVGSSPMLRMNGELDILNNYAVLTEADIESAFTQLATPEKLEIFKRDPDLDFKYFLPDGITLRCNAALERHQLSLSIRLLPALIPTLDELNLPELYKKLALLNNGLVIISGPTGSGKTTTQAAMIEYINANLPRQILSIEDPIEYSHRNIKSNIVQRELGSDTLSIAKALKHAMRHDPDVIVVGEMRDAETAEAVISMAETGHLVISTGHASYAAQAVERIIDLFPYNERALVQLRLASLLTAVFCQILVPRSDNSGRIAAVEIMEVNAAIRNLIRAGKITLLTNIIHDYGQNNNTTLDEALVKLYWRGLITGDTVYKYCRDKEEINRLLGNTATRVKIPVLQT
jgi:twitching motility protein PilT